MKAIIQTITNQVQEVLQNSNKKGLLKHELTQILGLIDLTTLEGSDTNQSVKLMCQKAISYPSIEKSLPESAAVCVYPTMVTIAGKELQNHNIIIAAVAGAFPSSQSPLEIRLSEVQYAIDMGATEIDMVISTGRFLEGDYAFITNEVSSIKKICGKHHLKVILETGVLKTTENIKLAAELAIGAGADFIKTSTGKVPVNATPEAMITMCRVIKDEYQNTGKRIGIKAAGGISDSETALLYFYIVKEILGESWLNKDLFRIGASRLADHLVKTILVL
ncbi:MAG: deoxyribose-phosphate aldolase [Bacteroidales bacterium]|nr:deoxyribose-phosphate aldolase [Bacteroidales bacterium]